jgi:hypothetical protein
MSKIFKYDRVIGEYYILASDEYEYESEEFSYEVSDEDLMEEVVNIIYAEYFKGYFKGDKEKAEQVKLGIKAMIKDNELLETLVENYEYDLKDIFENEALGLC